MGTFNPDSVLIHVQIVNIERKIAHQRKVQAEYLQCRETLEHKYRKQATAPLTTVDLNIKQAYESPPKNKLLQEIHYAFKREQESTSAVTKSEDQLQSLHETQRGIDKEMAGLHTQQHSLSAEVNTTIRWFKRSSTFCFCSSFDLITHMRLRADRRVGKES